MYVLRRVQIKRGEFLHCPACRNETLLVEFSSDVYFTGRCEECKCVTSCEASVSNTGTITVTSSPSTTWSKIG